MKVNTNGFAHVGCAGSVQAQRNSGLIEMGVEARRALEGANVEFVGIFERDLGFIGDGLGHRAAPCNNGCAMSRTSHIMIYINYACRSVRSHPATASSSA